MSRLRSDYDVVIFTGEPSKGFLLEGFLSFGTTPVFSFYVMFLRTMDPSVDFVKRRDVLKCRADILYEQCPY